MNRDKFLKRSGTTDQGKDYENLLVAYYSLKLTINENVEEFKISSNNEKYGNFDDLVVEIFWKNGVNEEYNVQAKHKQTNKNKNLVLEALMAEKGKFSIKKRIEEYKKEEYYKDNKLILYTNRKLEVVEDTELIHNSFFSVYIAQHHEKNPVLNTSVRKSGNVYKFYIRENDTAQNEQTIHYRNFLKNFYLYTNQENVNNLKDTILKIFMHNFRCDENVVKNYLDFIINWSNRDGNKEKLTKHFLRMKISECVLSPYVIPLSTNRSTKKSNILKQAINAFDVTIIPKTDKNIDFYRENIEETSLEVVNQFGKKYHNISEIPPLKQATLLWLSKQCPLLVKITNSNEKTVFRTINLCQGTNQKFVLIGTQNFCQNWKTFHTLEDLYNENLQIYNEIITTFECSFQGQKKVYLEEIINNNEEIRKIITTKELILMLDDCWNFGESKEYVPDYYIERKLSKTTIDFSFIDKFGDVNVIVISCNGKFNILKNHIRSSNFLIVEETLDSSPPSDSSTEFFSKNNIYISYEKCPPEFYNQIREQNSSSSCHYFQIDDNDNLEWLSSCNVEDVRPFQTKVIHFVEEKKTIDTHELNLICANPGMGKSMLMSNLKNNYSSKTWTMKILLREHSVFFEKSNDYQQFLEYILNKMNLSCFEKAILEIFQNDKKIIFIWDGIDETSKEAFDNVLRVIEDLKQIGFIQWITARSNLKQFLEDRFNVMARVIKPFDKGDQDNYIKKRLYPSKVEDIDQLSTEIMKKIDGNHLEVPLQIFMLTELFLHNEKACRILLARTISLSELFGYFIREKFNFYYKKANIDISNNVAKQILEEHKSHRFKFYETLALNLCLDKTILETLNLNKIEDFVEKILAENDSFGILEVINNHVNFAHRTYAEYFVALWLSKNYKKIKNLEDFFFDQKYKSIRFMFDLIMAKCCPINIAVLYENFEELEDNLDKADAVDQIGRSPLHVATSWGETHPLLETLHESERIIIATERSFGVTGKDSNHDQMIETLISRCNINQKDELFQYDCIEYADRSLSLSLLNSISKFTKINLGELRNFKDVSTVLYYCIKFNYLYLFKMIEYIPYIETTQSTSLLHLAAEFNRQLFLAKILENELYKNNINKRDNKKWAPIHYASCMGHIDVIKKLKEMGGDIHLGRKTREETPLFVAAQHGQQEVLEYLIKNNAKIDVSKKNGWTPLLVAVQKQNFPIVKTLVGHGADVNLTNQEGFSPLYVASRKGDIEIVKFLLSKNAKVNLMGKNGEGPLYIAAKLGHSKVARCLIQNGANVNVIKSNGWTPLMVACRYGHCQIVKLLLENNAIFNVVIPSLFNRMRRNKPCQKCTLDLAVENGDLKIAHLLIQRGAKIDGCCVSKAVKSGRLEMVKLLVENGGRVDPSLAYLSAERKNDQNVNVLTDKIEFSNEEERAKMNLRLKRKLFSKKKSQSSISTNAPKLSPLYSRTKRWLLILKLVFVITIVVSAISYLLYTKGIY